MARSYGASDAAVLESRDIVLDPRVKLKCMVPQCANYGRNLMCPPNVMGMDDFSEVLERYTRSILVQYPIPMDTEFMSKFSGSSIEDIYETGEYEERMTKSERQFQDLLGKLESDALNMGCRFAAAFTGGPCRLCDECVGQGSGERCRHPFRSRPSMEAMGIDVYLTARNAGLPFEIPAKDRPVWNGLLLVD
jgi:predicted metal-binding protein